MPFRRACTPGWSRPSSAALEVQAHERESLEEAVDHGFGILIDKVLAERELSRAFMMLSAFDPVCREGRAEQPGAQSALGAVLAPW